MAASFEDLILARFCSENGGTITDNSANDSLLAAYLVANGPQAVTVASGRQYVVLAYGAPPGWKVRPGP
jgi:hypothetical protein